MKRILLLTAVFIMMLGTSFSFAQADADNFYKSDWVKVEKVSFSNQYKMKVAGNLFLPKTMKEGEKYPAIIVGHPMGAVQGTECEPVRYQNGGAWFCNAVHRLVFLGCK